MKYRKKPVVVEAFQWTGKNTKEILNLMKENDSDRKAYPRIVQGKWCLGIETLEGWHIASVGDYIIKGIKGEFYPCKPDIFEATYELVEENGGTDYE